MKKRGFGVNKWNGVGGKPNEGEDIKQAAIRETREEIEVQVNDLELVAEITFYFESHPEWNQQTIAYISTNWKGTPTETDEMRPQWFKKDELPLNAMWPADKHWLLVVLQGKKVTAEFLLDESGSVINFNVKSEPSLPASSPPGQGVIHQHPQRSLEQE